MATTASSGGETTIELQSDTTKYGRGEQHLSFVLEEGKDVVAYQTGTWLVDGVEVGSGQPAKISYALIDTIQLVWTHNCEHGVLRGQELVVRKIVPEEQKQNTDDDDISHSRTQKRCLLLVTTGEIVEFGPEQLIARIPVEWLLGDDNGNLDTKKCVPLVELDEKAWIIEVD